MAELINGIKVPFIPIIKDNDFNISKKPTGTESFDTIFKTELEKLKFSSHAAKRLESRNIQLSDMELGRLKEAVDKAESKGAKDSLVMVDNTAFIVNIPNRTVVTAFAVEQGGDNVFTNIDSVVFAQ